MKRVARDLEEFREGFSMVFPGIADRSSVGTTVIVFRDDSSFKPYKPLYEGKPANISGYFQPGTDINYISLTADTETSHVIYHEYVHSLTRDSTNRLPAWASEGLAEFYSQFEVSGNGRELILGRAMGQHVQTLRERQLMPVQALLGVTHSSPEYNERTKQGIFYAESWALVHYLLTSPSGRPKFTAYLKLLASGRSIDESFHEAFQTDYVSLERDLSLYLRNRLTWPAFRVVLEEKIDVDKEMQLAPLADAQADYYLGDLLLHSNRYDVAEKQLQKSIAADPSLGISYASMGMLRLRQKQYPDALQFLSKAVDSDSGNYMTHFYYASLLQKLADDANADARRERLESMRTHLKKSIELGPHFVEAYSWLGYVATALNQEIDETEALVGKATVMAPGREDLKLTLGRLMAINHKTAAARAMVAVVKNSTRDDDIRGQATSLLESIESRLASEQAMREYEQRQAELAQQAAERPAVRATTDEPPVIRRAQPASSTPAESNTAPPPAAQKVAGPQITGMLSFMDCSHGLTLEVRVGNGTVKLHTDNPSKTDFVSFISDVKNSIACGPVKPETPVVITYRRGGDPSFLGEPLVVEFRK